MICDRQLTVARPSSPAGRVRRAAGGRHVVPHLMHGVMDRCAFAVWRGELERSPSLSPNGGVAENIGEPLPFEAPYRGRKPPRQVAPRWLMDGAAW
ncbi:DUF6928 family protein [Streptomyces sp. NPDC002164]|uniref:DUF6928 family protein n=1 Tax=unclassified Streptomyces TaxID=2593676 RepID=UPI0036AD7EA0